MSIEKNYLRSKINIAIFGILVLGCFFSSCEKESLDNEHHWLVGRWKSKELFWSPTFSNYQQNNQSYEPVYSNVPIHYIEFDGNGNVNFYNSETKLIDKGRLKELSYHRKTETGSDAYYTFELVLKGLSKNIEIAGSCGYIKASSLIVGTSYNTEDTLIDVFQMTLTLTSFGNHEIYYQDKIIKSQVVRYDKIK